MVTKRHLTDAEQVLSSALAALGEGEDEPVLRGLLWQMRAKIALEAGWDRQARVALDRAEDYLRSGLAGDHAFLAGLAADRAMEMANTGNIKGIDQLLAGGAFLTGNTPPGASLNSMVVNLSQCAGPEAIIEASQAKAVAEAAGGSGQLAFDYAAGAAWVAANSFGERSAPALRAQLFALEMQLEYGDLPPDLKMARGPLQFSALGAAIRPPMKLTPLTVNPSQAGAAIETARDALAKDDPGRVLAARAVARSLLLLGRPREAQSRAEEAVALARSVYGAGHPEVAKAQLVEGNIAAALHNPAAAQNALVAALASFEAAYGATSPDVNQVLIVAMAVSMPQVLAHAWLALGDGQKANSRIYSVNGRAPVLLIFDRLTDRARVPARL